MLTKEKLLGPPMFSPVPHVVVLGAGASRAAFPTGDRSGKLLPVMNELPAILGEPWKKLMHKAQPPMNGFEAQFSWIRRQARYSDDLREIERIIFRYFDSLELPDGPTLYD